MNTSLIINSRDTAGNALQKTITYINPESTNADLKVLAQKLTNISSNSYVDASRVNKINVDEQDGEKTTPNISIEERETVSNDEQIEIHAADAENLSVGNLSHEVFARIGTDDDDGTPFIVFTNLPSGETFTGTLYAAETEYDKAAKYDFEFTAE